MTKDSTFDKILKILCFNINLFQNMKIYLDKKKMIIPRSISDSFH